MKLKPLTILTVVLSSLTILFFGTLMITQSSCTKTPTVSVVAKNNVEARAAEKEAVTALIINLNEKIPPQKVVLKSDVDRIIKLIHYLIESAGYNESEYELSWWICTDNHFHTHIKITTKYRSGNIELDGKYQYNDNDI